MGNKELLEWYKSGENSNGMVVVAAKPEEPIKTCDLSLEKPESPQADIQKEIINQELGKQLTTQSDPLIVKDKLRIHKAIGIVEVIKRKLLMFDALAGPQIDDPVKKEDIASSLKILVNDLSEILGSL
jgi:hypothetical protein